jgi:hypothetical protein
MRTLSDKIRARRSAVPLVILSMNTAEQVESTLAAAEGDYPDSSLIQRVHQLNMAC